MRALQECSGFAENAAGVQQFLRECSGRICGFLPGGLPLPDSSPFRVPADQPAGLQAESRSNVSNLNTGRLAAPKACVPTWGIDVGALGGQLRSCAGWECRPARVFFSPGADGLPPASGRASETSRR